MRTASCLSGTGRARSCTASGRRTTTCASASSGTPTRRPRWPPAAGTGSLSTGTENSINVCGTEKSMYWRPLALSTGTKESINVYGTEACPKHKSSDISRK